MRDNFDLKGYLRRGNKLLNESDSQVEKTLRVNVAFKALGELDDEFARRNNVKIQKPKGIESIDFDSLTPIEKYKMSQVPVKFTGTKENLAALLDGDLASQIYGDEDAYFNALNRLFKTPKVPMNEGIGGYIDLKPMNELTDFGNMEEDQEGESENEREPEGDQYDGQYDAHSGPAITSEGFNFEDFINTDLDGSAVEGAINNLITEFDGIIKSKVPQELQQSARIEVKKLWLRKLNKWKS